MINQIRNLKHADPFVPFELALAGGEPVVVRSPDSIALSKDHFCYLDEQGSFQVAPYSDVDRVTRVVPDETFHRIQELSRSEPFMPFTLVLSSGTRHEVKTRDHIFFLRDDGGTPIGDWFQVAAAQKVHTVFYNQVSSIEVGPSAPSVPVGVTNPASKQIKTAFSGFLAEKGFCFQENPNSPEPFGNGWAIFCCSEWCLRIVRDRGQYFLEVRDRSSDTRWHDIRFPLAVAHAFRPDSWSAHHEDVRVAADRAKHYLSAIDSWKDLDAVKSFLAEQMSHVGQVVTDLDFQRLMDVMEANEGDETPSESLKGKA